MVQGKSLECSIKRQAPCGSPLERGGGVCYTPCFQFACRFYRYSCITHPCPSQEGNPSRNVVKLIFWGLPAAGLYAHTAQALATWPVSAAIPNPTSPNKSITCSSRTLQLSNPTTFQQKNRYLPYGYSHLRHFRN
jgi:hypothetical protein